MGFPEIKALKVAMMMMIMSGHVYEEDQIIYIKNKYLLTKRCHFIFASLTLQLNDLDGCYLVHDNVRKSSIWSGEAETGIWKRWKEH